MSERSGEQAGRGRIGRALDGIASNTSRRGFLARVGKGMAAVTAGGAVAKLVQPGEADGYHFCGHIYATDSCSSRAVAISGPSLFGGKVAYVATIRKGQSIRVRALAGHGLGRSVYRARKAPPTLWTTALSRDRVYVTRVARSGRGTLVSVNR